MAKKIEIDKLQVFTGCGYPAQYAKPCLERLRHRLGDAAGLSQFGVNLLRLAPGVWSSQRHWHTAEDELTYVLQGEVILVTDSGEETLRAGDCAGFKAGVADGHHFQNRSNQEVLLLEIGSRMEIDEVYYPDIDLMSLPSGYAHRDGRPYGDEEKGA
jgi:uncharacterized cupin superfamily protein